MKNVLFKLSLILLLAISVSSCKKCIECTYTIGGTQTSAEEYCGSSAEVKDFEDAWKAAGDMAGAESECH